MKPDCASNAPAAVVQRQLDAYNARDLNTLLAVYAEDAELFEHPSKLVARGTDGSSELDHADPPVTDAELRDGSVLTRKRTWIERKDYNINSSDQAMAVARTHYRQAVADLGNLPPGSTIAVEYARYKVRSNAIVPGWIDTEMASGALHWDKFIERNMPRTPARRWGEGHDFAGIAAYLAGPASSYHTGDVITIDGGYYIA